MAAVLARRRACPPCGHTLCRGWGRAHGVPRLRCAAGGKTFNVLTGTPLARLRNRACWGAYAQALIDGPSVRAAACTRIPPVAGATASLPSPPRIKPAHLHGIVAADETDFLESHKEERHLPRPPHQRGGVATKRGLSDEQIPVLIVRDRRATTTDAVLPKANTAAISAVLGPILDPDTVRGAPTAARSTAALPRPPTSPTPGSTSAPASA